MEGKIPEHNSQNSFVASTLSTNITGQSTFRINEIESPSLNSERGSQNFLSERLQAIPNDADKSSNKEQQTDLDQEIPQSDDFRRIEKILPKFMLTRTDLCKHKHGCYENVVKGFYKAFVNSLMIKLVVSNISNIINFRKLFKSLLSYKNNKDHIRFALFVALMNAVYKFFLCALRRVLKCDKKAAPIAGFIAGLCLGFDQKSRRQFLTVLILSRFTETSINMAIERGMPFDKVP